MGLLTPEAKAALSSGVVHLAVLVELDFSTGTERYWTGLHTLNHEGEDWLAAGNMGSVSPIESSEDLHANGLTLSLGGLPGDAMRTIRRLEAAEYKGRNARLLLGICFLGGVSGGLALG